MGINVNPANLNQVVQTTVNQAVRAIEEEYLFDGQNAANNTNETNSTLGSDIVNVVTELLPSLVSTLVNTILEQLGLKQKPSEPQQPAQLVVPESPKGVIEELESQKAQLEADKAVAEQEYVEAMNNRHLMLSVYSSPNSQNRAQVNLTYDSLTAGLNGSPQYRLVDPQTGKVVVANMDEVEKKFLLGDDCIYMPELKNFQVLQKALQDGTLGVEKCVIEQKGNKHVQTWQKTSLSAMADVSSELYTADDNAATAKYETSVAKIESEIKKIDIQIAVEKAETPEIKALELQKVDILKSNEQISQEYVEAMNNHTTADDNAAMAKYEATTLQNQAKMKELDVRIAEAKTRYAQELSIKNAAEKAETPEIKALELQKLDILKSNEQISQEYVEAMNNHTTADDSAAMAKYETTVLKNQAKMKELDVKIAQAKEKYAQEIKADKTVNNKEPEETEEQQVVQKDYTARQVERYEKYIAKYEKQIDLLENSNDPNKQAKISALMDKIEKYMNKINQLID